MTYPTNLGFNPDSPSVMHIDLNSCFATIEQQANPQLRGKPIAVAAYDTPSGCILAPSIEAKEHGIKTGMRVREGKSLYPQLIVLTPDPWKYRSVHIALGKILSTYTNDFHPKSIDEFVLDLKGYPSYKKGMHYVAREIKQRIKKEVGEWIRASIGISTNRFLAKTGAGLHKPDGLNEINKENFLKIYSKLQLTDLTGIAKRNESRLRGVGIYTVEDFYEAPVRKLKAAFNSINGYYWYLRLRGWEIDKVPYDRKSYGNSYALPQPFVKLEDLSPILSKLVTKMTSRLRKAGYKAKGVHVSLSYKDGGYWHKGKKFPKELFETSEVYKKAYNLLSKSPRKPVRELSVSCFNLIKSDKSQLELFDKVEEKEELVNSIDKINERWGEFIVAHARVMLAKDHVHDRIAFGGVKELEEFVTSY